jgi:nicotinamidase-related amidase
LNKDRDVMPTLNRESSALLVVDFQSKLMPAIEGGASVTANARRLIDAAEMLQVPILFTEQNVRGLGSTVPELRSDTASISHKMTFDACRMPGVSSSASGPIRFHRFGMRNPCLRVADRAGSAQRRPPRLCRRDAMGSRRAESKETAIQRMERNGAEVVTTEMVVFEWLGTAEDPRLRKVIDLIR